MKKNRALAAAMASIALTGALGSCSFAPDENVEEDVYGPPQPYEDPIDEPESVGEPESAGNTILKKTWSRKYTVRPKLSDKP